jgi:hypothetical protein
LPRLSCKEETSIFCRETVIPKKRAVRSTANLGGTAEKYNRPLRDAGLFLFGGKCLVWHNVKIKEK